jgi:hypothetical protein
LFRVTGFSAAMLAVSQLRPVSAAARPAPSALRVLSAGDARIMGAIAERIAFTGDPGMPRFADTAGLQTIDTALLQLPSDTVQQLHYALLLVEYGPPLFALRLSTFTSLGDDAKDSYLAGWEQSRFATRQIAFRALKNLALLGYYSQDATWAGIHYSGPWVPRPRRVVSGEG